MAYDSVRAQLDKLLGPERNGPLTEPAARPVSYSDASVCKHYLLGFCPYDLHIKHRSEPGSCPKQHPSAALTAFRKDKEAGKLRGDVARWNRASLTECRAILADEDRKIRNHARRLQESYGAKGDLNGLMIRSFDTLKALGMVSKDAKVRILSEMEEGDDVIADEHVNQEAETEAAAEAERTTSDAEAEIKVEKISAPTKVEAKSSGSESASVEGALQAEEGSDDDIEGFGVIKVIPAGAGGKDEKLTATPHDADNEAQPGKDAEKDSERTEQKQLSGVTEQGGADPKSTAAKVLPNENVKSEEGSPAPGNASNGDALKSNTTSATASHLEVATDGPEKGGNEPVDVMEQFYASGTGPDGLLMLDRKQTLRVCLCCGGYISLVDAESRLLSHFGGKSHHSLVQLRERVAELERIVANEERFILDVPPREYPRNRHDDRESNGARESDFRSSRPERHRGRHDRGADRRGHGTSEWYNGSSRSYGDHYGRGARDGRDYRGRSLDRRPRDERYRDRDRHYGRYESGRKRHRSRSPDRSGRRQRYRY